MAASEVVARKRMLYKSKVEYMAGEGVYCMNHAVGCWHGCEFPCYAFAAARRRGEVSDLDEWRCVRPVGNALELLAEDIGKRRKEPVERVHMCFTTDPFPYTGELWRGWHNREFGRREMDADPRAAALEACIRVTGTTIRAIGMLNGAGIPVTVLTKGVLPRIAETVDEDSRPAGRALIASGMDSIQLPCGILHPGNEYGITLSSLDEAFREKWEPGAAPYEERIASLRALHDQGCRTWVSMEPFPAIAGESSPFEVLARALQAVEFADRIVFGRWNYSAEAPCNVGDPDLWYRHASRIARTFCDARGIECIVKKGTDK